MCTTYVPDARESQKRALEPLKLGLWMVVACGCWESNPGSLKEQQVLLTAEPSLQPLGHILHEFCFGYRKG